MFPSILSALVFVCLAQLATATSHFYDDADRLIRTVYPSGSAVIYTYDSADNLLTVTPTTAPLAPASIQAVLTGTTSALITWEDLADDETGYRIERRSAHNYIWAIIADLPANSTEYIDEPLDPNETYVYRIYAIDSSGSQLATSAYSAEAVAAGAGSETFSIRSFQIEGDQVEILFDAQAASSYRLESSETILPGSWLPTNFSLTPSSPETLTMISGLNGSVVIYIEFPEADRKFFRLVRE